MNPDQDSLQRLRAIRGEVDAPMRAPKPARTAQACCMLLVATCVG